jgi:nickel transport protein
MIARLLIWIIPAVLAMPPDALAHAINYRLENKGISARVFFTGDDPMRYATYEIFGPGDTIVFQNGRTSRNGVVSFLPDRPGKWKIKVSGLEAQGPHATELEIIVSSSLDMESFHKPLVAQHTKAFVGLSFLMFPFSLWVFWRNYKRNATRPPPNNFNSNTEV